MPAKKDKDKLEAASRQRLLLYRVVPHNGGVVFALADRATLIAKLHHALERSRTWGEFRKAIPPAEYSAIIRHFDENGEKRPRSSDRFSGDDVPGYCDGDYPPWLQSEMDRLAPYSLWQEVGRLESTSLNGDFWLIPEKNLKAACQALRNVGWSLKRAQRLPFY